MRFLSRIFLYIFYILVYYNISSRILTTLLRSSSARNCRYFVGLILNAMSRRVKPLADFYDRFYIEATFTACVFCCSHGNVMLSRRESVHSMSSRAIVLRVHSCSRSHFLRFFSTSYIHRAEADTPCLLRERTPTMPRQNEE